MTFCNFGPKARPSLRHTSTPFSEYGAPVTWVHAAILLRSGIPFNSNVVLFGSSLARAAEPGYSFGMSTISVSELKKKPAGQWLKSAAKTDLIVTSNGRPVALLLHIAEASVESTRSLARSVRALQAQAALQQTAVARRVSPLAMSDIDAEIVAARRSSRRTSARRARTFL
jgi:prevent-host-death family protein